MRKILVAAGFVLAIGMFLPSLAYAQMGILPQVGQEVDCQKILRDFTNKSDDEKRNQLVEPETQEKLLGCAIRTGRISVKMLPFFITYLIRFAIALAGLVAVLFIVVGGYKYTLGGLTDDKESGKKTILYAIVGLVVSLLAWIIVNIIQVQLTR